VDAEELGEVMHPKRRLFWNSWRWDSAAASLRFTEAGRQCLRRLLKGQLVLIAPLGKLDRVYMWGRAFRPRFGALWAVAAAMPVAYVQCRENKLARIRIVPLYSRNYL
jgi:hypothetical protein